MAALAEIISSCDCVGRRGTISEREIRNDGRAKLALVSRGCRHRVGNVFRSFVMCSCALFLLLISWDSVDMLRIAL